MPNYRTHNAVSFSTGAALAYGAVVELSLPLESVFIAAGSFALATLLLSPDLDLKHSSPTKNWFILRWIWRPYQWIFKHRGFSHSLLFSSLTRVAYLIAACVFVVGLQSVFSSQSLDARSLLDLAIAIVAGVHGLLGDYGPMFLAAGAGIWLSDACHILTDRIFSAVVR